MLVGGAKPHDVFDAGAVVPAAIEDDDLPGRRKALDVALNVYLRLFTVGRRRQRNDAKHARAHALCNRFDGSPLAGAIAPFKHKHDPPAFRFDPFLEMTKFRLQPAHFFFVLLTLELGFLVAVLSFRHRSSRCMLASSCTGLR